MKKEKQNSGITLIALVITIIVLLILAGVTIAILTGDNGLIGKTGDAKDATEIAEEREVIEVEYISALGKNKIDNLSKIQTSLQQGLDKSMGDGKTTVTLHGEGFDVLIVDKNYYYTIDDDGKVTGPEEVIEVEYAGDYTKNNKYDGTTEDKAYRIECIEDLVKLSEKSKNTWITDKYIIITTDLDFKSVYSYNNYKTTEFGNLNGNDQDGNELYTEMTTGTGFNPINSTGTSYLTRGTFDGKGHWIKNLYQNYTTDRIGLFATGPGETTIKNLNITGKITGNNYVGAIFGYGSSNIENCNNYATISGNGYVGGLAGFCFQSISVINNCKNYGNIIGSGNGLGGIAGQNGVLEYCENYGKIKGVDRVGGIIGGGAKIRNSINYGEIVGNNEIGGINGESMGSTYYIENCYNKGKVTGNTSVAGIEGHCERSANIINSYNIGSVSGTNYVGGIIGNYGPNWSEDENYCYNCYNVGSVRGTTSVGGAIGYINAGYSSYYKNMYYLNSVATKGIGNKDNSEGVVESKTDNQLKADAMITLLNGNNTGTQTIWFKDTKNINGGYPILYYQNK